MKIENADISWLDSGLPYSPRYQDIYHSRDDALAESQHVFIAANRLSQRWNEAESEDKAFVIAELGFGVGLNFLQVVNLWRGVDARPHRLHYLAFEKHPPRKSQIEKIHRQWPGLKIESKELLASYPDHSGGCHRLSLADNVYLDLYYGDAYSQLNARCQSLSPAIDCWFLDGFSPKKNTELWDEHLMQLLASNSHRNTTLSSYTVAGSVRRALQASGFEIQKLAGHGKKRHMLFATFQANSTGRQKSAADISWKQKPWLQLPHFVPSQRKAVVIGAGLAGCSSAYSLARRGWQVTVLDQAQQPVAGASGNKQLALRCRLYRAHSPLMEYFLQCFLFAARQFSSLQEESAVGWHNSGVIQLKTAVNKRHLISNEEIEELYSDRVVKSLSQLEASENAGVELSGAAWFLPEGGWINPHALCRAYLSHPNITLRLASQVQDIQFSDNAWLLRGAAGSFETIESTVVIIANSFSAGLFEQCKSLPLLGVRGQTTEVAGTSYSRQLKTVVSGERTVFPVQDKAHLLAASYSTDCQNTANHEQDSLDNLELAGRNFTNGDFLSRERLTDRVSIRCNSVDHLPIIGMLPDADAMRKNYAGLSSNAHATFDTPGSYYPGLYINVAHGSNGLASCPLSGEFLASLINHENLPLSRAMIDELNPVRFLIRDLKKQR